MTQAFQYVFPAVRGIQAGREYYVSMCPLKLIPKIFLFDEDELTPELRSQRTLNKARVPEMSRYLTEQPNDYVFSALTASVDADIVFEPSSEKTSDVGLLQVPMSGRFIINDGQHRRAAIEAALKARPRLGDETIAVVFFHDIGLARSQQMFADLNRYAIRPSTSISMLYDHRDQMAELARRVVRDAHPFREMVEMERSTLSLRSRRLFTFSAIYQATHALFASRGFGDLESDLKLARHFWETLATKFPDWESVRTGRIAAREVRQDLIHSHGVVLHAFGRLGSMLLSADPASWNQTLAPLCDIDWARTNPAWEGRAVMQGRLSKATQNVILTSNFVKGRLGIDLSHDELKLEEIFAKGGARAS